MQIKISITHRCIIKTYLILNGFQVKLMLNNNASYGQLVPCQLGGGGHSPLNNLALGVVVRNLVWSFPDCQANGPPML